MQKIQEMTWVEFRDSLKAEKVAIVPIGSIEPHGYHAPLGTDTFVAEEIAERLGKLIGAFVAPTISYGCSELVYDISDWIGTISISPESITSLIVDIGNELSRMGIKKIIIVNGHINNSSPLEIAAFKIWKKTGTPVGILEWWIVNKEQVRQIKGVTHGTHADEIETSLLMVSDKKNTLKLDKAQTNPNNPAVSSEEFQMYIYGMKFTRKLDERWIGKSGNYGNPQKATTKIGESLIQQTLEAGVKLIKALDPYIRR